MSDITFIVANKRQNGGVTNGVVGSKYFTDCTVSIEHTFSNTVTEHAVERGANFTDHVQQNNSSFNVSGVFSDIPLSTYAGDELPLTERVRAAYQFLQQLRTAGTKFTLVSKYDSYNDCVIESLSIPADGSTNLSLKFDISIKQIRSATTESINVVEVGKVAPRKQDDAAKVVNEGKKQPLQNVLLFVPTATENDKFAEIKENLKKRNAGEKAQKLLESLGVTRP